MGADGWGQSKYPYADLNSIRTLFGHMHNLMEPEFITELRGKIAGRPK